MTSDGCGLWHTLDKCGDLFNRMTKQMDTAVDAPHGILSPLMFFQTSPDFSGFSEYYYCGQLQGAYSAARNCT